MYKYNISIIIALLWLGSTVEAQKSGEVPADSAKVYRSIEAYSAKRPFTKMLYGLFLKPVAKHAKPSKKRQKVVAQKTYQQYDGRIIRNIEITTLDPFGFSVTDTAKTKSNFIYKAGNNFHIKTLKITIRNLLLFHPNQPLDPLLLKESERLIRSQLYVRDVLFTVIPVSAHSDSVDIAIRELDLWSMLPQASVSASSTRIKLTDRNFLGTGHQLFTKYQHRIGTNINGYEIRYDVPNIRNSYITSAVSYVLDLNKNHGLTILVDRPFYTPLAKWAGGIEYKNLYKADSLISDTPDVYVPFDKDFSSQDYWGGVAVHLFKGKTEYERTSNIILSGRFYHVNFLKVPLPLYDPLGVNTNEDFLLGGLGISSRQYLQSKFIFNYGVTEDVPIGWVVGITGGYQYKNNTERLYAGVRFAYGNYRDWGYFSTNIEYGSYIRALHSEQAVALAELNYFTNLLIVGNWRFRQFVRPRVVFGINRFPSESLTINNEFGIRGFESSILKGTQKLLLTFQTQSYAPWSVWGFHFGPYFTSTIAVLGDASLRFKKSHIYSQFGLGCLIKNQFLIFSSFQISVAYYPSIPGQGDNYIKLNPSVSSDYGFSNFVIGKPEAVGFE